LRGASVKRAKGRSETQEIGKPLGKTEGRTPTYYEKWAIRIQKKKGSPTPSNMTGHTHEKGKGRKVVKSPNVPNKEGPKEKNHVRDLA